MKRIMVLFLAVLGSLAANPYKKKDLEHLTDKVEVKEIEKQYWPKREKIVNSRPPDDMVPLIEDESGKIIWISKELLSKNRKEAEVVAYVGKEDQ